jgi:hypothetical protein
MYFIEVNFVSINYKLIEKLKQCGHFQNTKPKSNFSHDQLKYDL